jgi:hypothetical protein
MCYARRVSASDFKPARTVVCARCGAAFGCGLSAECWCALVPARLPLPDDGGADDCLCPDCLRRAAGLASGNTAK